MLSRSRVLTSCAASLLVLGLSGCQSDDASDAAAPEKSTSTSSGTTAVAAEDRALPNRGEVSAAKEAATHAITAMLDIGYPDYDDQVLAAERLLTDSVADEYATWASEGRDPTMDSKASHRTEVVRSGIAGTDVDTVVVMSFVDRHGSTGVEPSTWTDEITILLTMVRGAADDPEKWMVDEFTFNGGEATDADPTRHAVTTVAWEVADFFFNVDARTWDNWIEGMDARTRGDWFERVAERFEPMITGEHAYWRGAPRVAAVESLTPRRAVVLVHGSGVEGVSGAEGQRDDDETPWMARFELTLRKVEGRWLLSDLTYVSQPEMAEAPMV